MRGDAGGLLLDAHKLLAAVVMRVRKLRPQQPEHPVPRRDRLWADIFAEHPAAAVERAAARDLDTQVAQIAGSIPTNMTDYGISPPSVGFTTVQPEVTIEFQLNLAAG